MPSSSFLFLISSFRLHPSSLHVPFEPHGFRAGFTRNVREAGAIRTAILARDLSFVPLFHLSSFLFPPSSFSPIRTIRSSSFRGTNALPPPSVRPLVTEFLKKTLMRASKFRDKLSYSIMQAKGGLPHKRIPPMTSLVPSGRIHVEGLAAQAGSTFAPMRYRSSTNLPVCPRRL